jgi:hypothetical protein
MTKKGKEYLAVIKKRVEQFRKNLPEDSPFYTQRQWDRTVGWGKVPNSRKILKKT